MTWAIVWTETALRDMARLERTIARRIVAKLKSIADDPAPRMTRLAGSDDWRLRVGDYRVLCLLSFSDSVVIVERVAHRSKVYRE